MASPAEGETGTRTLARARPANAWVGFGKVGTLCDTAQRHQSEDAVEKLDNERVGSSGG